jgi:hypothetical protein
VRRLLLTLVVAALVTVTASTAAAASSPSLRVVPGPALTIAGAGFVPRTLVRLRLTSSGRVLRILSVRTGGRGGFHVRFPALEACSPTLITAAGAGGRLARVPAAWFVRECPPPPPLEP